MNLITIRLVERAVKKLPPNNLIARKIASLVRMKGISCDQIKMNILYELNERGKEDAIVPKRDETLFDLRFQRLMLHGFHKFPYKSEDFYYVLPFGSNGMNCSCIYIGSNGSGKTSLFSAIELLCTDSLSAARLQGVDKTQYIPHAGINMNQVDIQIESNEGAITMDNVLQGRLADIRPYLKPFFYSEYDTMKMAESSDITDYIIQQSELKEMHDLMNMLGAMYKEALDRKELFKEQLDKISTQEKSMQLEILKDLYADCNRLLFTKDTNVRLLQIAKLTKRLHIPLRIKSISINSKIEKRSEQLKEAVASVKEISHTISEEYELLKALSINAEKFSEEYHRIIDKLNQVQYLSLQIEDNRNEGETDSKSALHAIRQQRSSLVNLMNLLRTIDMEHFSNCREQAATIFDDLSEAMQTRESPLSYAQRYQTRINELQNSLDTKDIESQQDQRLVSQLSPLKECIDALKNEYDLYIQVTYRMVSQTIHSILEEYNFKNEEIQIEQSEKGISIGYQFNQTVTFSPKQYLNSFRFKLYTLCVKISLAFSVMKNLNVRFPLVFDDVFYSSDFTNRERVREFIRKLFELYDTNVADKEHPLQIIFFTHDEVVMEAAQKGVHFTEAAYLYGRIFNYQEMEKLGKQQTDNNKTILPLCVIYSSKS